MSEPITYRSVGVDTEAKGRFTDSLADVMRRTFGPRVIDRPGGFAGLFRMDRSPKFPRNYKRPVLVTGADGVGTKLLVAVAMNDFSTIGIDLVAMSVNDVLVMGAEPLFFLDYLAVPRLEPDKLSAIVRGIAEGCRIAGCSLLGGETAEMPALYRPGEFDMAGFAVGVVEKARLVTGDAVGPGDVILGLASSGLHSNGYSLARKLIFDTAGHLAAEFVPELGCTVGEELLKPTRIYCRSVTALLAEYQRKKHGRPVHGMAHITGESFYGNVPRSLPAGLQAVIDAGNWPAPPIFGILQNLSGLSGREMFNTFNMGVGFVLIVDKGFAPTALDYLNSAGEKAYRIGHVAKGGPEVVISGI